MAIFDYQKFHDEYTKLSNLIGNLEGVDNSTIGGLMKSTDVVLNRALQDAEQSQWAATKLNDWTPIYNSLKTQLQRMYSLMKATAEGNAEYQTWEQQNSGM